MPVVGAIILRRGVTQGDFLSPSLFNVYKNEISDNISKIEIEIEILRQPFFQLLIIRFATKKYKFF